LKYRLEFRPPDGSKLKIIWVFQELLTFFKACMFHCLFRTKDLSTLQFVLTPTLQVSRTILKLIVIKQGERNKPVQYEAEEK